jgi:hypothetical protein
MFEYSIERYQKFDIHKDITHKSLHGITISKKYIDKIISSNNMRLIVDSNNAYKYYLLRRMNHVNSWYKNDLFDFYEPEYRPFTSKFLFVVNKTNNRLDNVISKCIFDAINHRISSNCSIYAIRDHAVSRAGQRISELFGWKPGKIYEWLDKKIDRLRPCSLNKPQYKVMALLNHRFEKCDYYMDENGRVYVVKDNMLTTIHCNESDRWVRN